MKSLEEESTEVPCVYTITGREKMIIKMKEMLHVKVGADALAHPTHNNFLTSTGFFKSHNNHKRFQP